MCKEAAASAMSNRTGTIISDLSKIEIDAHSIPIGKTTTQDAAADIWKRRMASNCAPHYNLNSVTNYNRFECRYLGKGVDDNGKIVQNPFKTWKGFLPSCDDGIEIPESVEEDIKKLVYHSAGGDEAKLDLNQFQCNITSIPHL